MAHRAGNPYQKMDELIHELDVAPVVAMYGPMSIHIITSCSVDSDRQLCVILAFSVRRVPKIRQARLMNPLDPGAL